jgi:hypothetical protein
MARDFGNEDAKYDRKQDITTNFVSTRETKEFLMSPKPFIIGAKGVGKSALLMKKAIELREQSGVMPLPLRKLVDRVGSEASLDERVYRRLSSNQKERLARWISIWKSAILRSVAHCLFFRLKDKREYRDEIKPLKKFLYLESTGNGGISGPPEFTPFHYYSMIIGELQSASIRKYPEIISSDLSVLETYVEYFITNVPPLYILLDNLDEFYELSPEQWRESMYGQFRASIELNELGGGRLKIITTLREDVYNSEVFRSEQASRWDNLTFPLKYDKATLLELFERRIQNLDEELLVDPSLRNSEPLKAFFGEEKLENQSVKVREDCTKYFLRHTLLRPRDMIRLGNSIIREAKGKPPTHQNIRDGVQSGAGRIARDYLTEIKMWLMNSEFEPHEFIRKYIHKNILTKAEVHKIYKEFKKQDAKGDEHPFCELCRVGLIGWIDRTATGGPTQRFFSPISPGPEDYKLIDSDYYLVHPILYDHPDFNIHITPDIVVGYDHPFSQDSIKEKGIKSPWD